MVPPPRELRAPGGSYAHTIPLGSKRTERIRVAGAEGVGWEQTTPGHPHGHHGEDEGQPTQQGARVEKARAQRSGLQVRQDVGGQRGEKAAF